jgi:hypothetical protein
MLFIATSVDVERLFSKGRALLPYLRNGLSAQSIRVLLCLGSWFQMGLIKHEDVMKVTSQDGQDDEELDLNFDKIDINTV